MSHIDVIADLSDKKLRNIPDHVLRRANTKMLYLERNDIELLPGDFFTLLPKLTWLDLRNNRLKEIPTSIAHHEWLETLLLQDNMIQMLPDELGTLPKLKVLQLAGNPLRYPPEEILKKGIKGICEFLKEKFNRSSEPELEISPPEVNKSKHETSRHKVNQVIRQSSKKMTIQELLRASSRSAMAMGGVWPVISIKSLGNPADNSAPKRTVADVFFVPKSNNKMEHIIKRSPKTLRKPGKNESTTNRKRSSSDTSLIYETTMHQRPKSAHLKSKMRPESKASSRPVTKASTRRPENKSPRTEAKASNKSKNLSAVSDKSKYKVKTKTELGEFKALNKPKSKRSFISENKHVTKDHKKIVDNSETRTSVNKVPSESINHTSKKLKKQSVKMNSPLSLKTKYSANDSSNKLVTMNDVNNNELKALWLENLKEVLNQQEAIIQQERNTNTLNSWRLQKKTEPLRKVSTKKLEKPYDTDPEYEKILSRKDIGQKTPKRTNRKGKPTVEKDLDDILSEVCLKLKELENTIQEPEKTQSGKVEAEKQIKEITMLQKKILQVRKAHHLT